MRLRSTVTFHLLFSYSLTLHRPPPPLPKTSVSSAPPDCSSVLLCLGTYRPSAYHPSAYRPSAYHLSEGFFKGRRRRIDPWWLPLPSRERRIMRKWTIRRVGIRRECRVPLWRRGNFLGSTRLLEQHRYILDRLADLRQLQRLRSSTTDGRMMDGRGPISAVN